jgi:diguanylate cyclase (GGDEF)-like protein/PAS domain S-box-containing protein
MADWNEDDWTKTWVSEARTEARADARADAPFDAPAAEAKPYGRCAEDRPSMFPARPARTTVPPAAWDAEPAQARVPAGRAGSFIVDQNGVLLAFDRNMERLTGWDAHEVVGRPKDLGLYGDADAEGVRAFAPRPLYEGRLPRVDQSQLVRLSVMRRDGAQLEVEALVSPLGGRGGRLSVDVHRVLSRLAAAEPAGLEEQDPLTRVAGAPRFHAELAERFEAARAIGHPLSLLLVDVDHLASINRMLGPEAGDDVLRHVAGVLTASLRHSDLVARLGDDDFAILLPAAGRGDARHVGGRIRAAIESFVFPGANPGELAITVSIGIACAPADAETPGELMRRTREALDEVRRLGRNRVWCYARRPRVKIDVPVYFDGPSGHLLGMGIDLSNSGIFIASRDDLPVGMRIGLSFLLPGQEEPVRTIGRVVRQVPPEPGYLSAPRGLGIEFERYGDHDRWRLEAYLHASREGTA